MKRIIALLLSACCLSGAAFNQAQQLFLLCVRKAPPAPPLPYDAEVEYLESTGTQYIDTGITLTSEIVVSSRFSFDESAANFSGMPFFYPKARGQNYGIYRNGDMFYISARSTANLPFDASWHVFRLDTSDYPSASLDGVHVVTGTGTFGSGAAISMLIFCRQNGSAVQYYGKGKIASFAVSSHTGELMQDLIPVRKNGVGYMYDKVSGQLLGNSGTGDFVIGPDK